jgi:hypothetical protein
MFTIVYQRSLELLALVSSSFRNLFDNLFLYPLGQLIDRILPLDINLPDWQIFDYTIIQLGLGLGLTFFVVFTIVKFFVNILP